MADTLAQRQTQLGKFVMAGYPKLGFQGWPMASACAVVGNATQENICLPVTPGVKDHGSDGTFQWRQGRLMEMQSWCVKNFGAWNTLEAQAAFMMFECQRDYPELWHDLFAGTKTIPTLTADFCNIYERPAAASAMLDKRIKYAEDAHGLLAAPTPASSGPVVAAGTVVATAAGAAATHMSGRPHWTSAAILGGGFLVLFALAVIEAHKKPAVPTVPVAQEPKK